MEAFHDLDIALHEYIIYLLCENGTILSYHKMIEEIVVLPPGLT